jgi:opacity protein-like surface antigen
MAGMLVASSGFAAETTLSNPTVLNLNTKIHWVAALNLGASIAQPGKTQTVAAYAGNNNYVDSGSTLTSLLVGGFVGLDIPLSPRFNYQVGLAYNYVSPYTLKGQIQQFSESQFTGFDYQYQVQSQQLFLESKLLLNATRHVHPYVSLGLGSAFNKSYDFSWTPLDSRAAGDPGTFADHSSTQFAYNLGLGVDFDVAKNVRVGAGYRFANFGKAYLGSAPDFISNKGLSTSLVNHQLLVTATYLF